MTDGHASLRIRAMRITLPGRKPLLHIEVGIDCDACGDYVIEIAGHHMATLAARFAEIVRDYPELCGEVGALTDKLDFEGVVVPGKETLN